MDEVADLVVDEGKEELYPLVPLRAVAVFPDFRVDILSAENSARDVADG